MNRFLISALLMPASLLFGQAASPTSVTVTATRNPTTTPDQVIFGVTVNAPITVSREDVLAAVKPAGVTISDFTGLYSYGPYVVTNGAASVPTAQWNFSVTVPLTSMKAEINTLTGLQLSMAQNNNGISLSFNVQGTQTSVTPDACSLTDLMSDARAQAQKIASAASMRVTSVLALANSAGACSLTVKFALGGF